MGISWLLFTGLSGYYSVVVVVCRINKLVGEESSDFGIEYRIEYYRLMIEKR